MDVAQIVATVIGVVTLLKLVDVPGDVRRNDLRIRSRNESLATCVTDDDKALTIDLRRITTEMAAAGHLYSGAIINAKQYAKDVTVQRYGDQKTQAELVVADVETSEGLGHRAWRWLTGRPVPALTAPEDVAEVIARWEEPEIAAQPQAA
jgi:hypothetical protein